MYIKSIFLAAVLGLGMIGAVPAIAQQVPAIAQQGNGDDLGQKLFVGYCSVCHGEMGAGGGSLSALLTVEIANLTHLSSNNDGVFPLLEVIQIMDGRSGLRGHEGPMPIFGEMFDSGRYGPYGAEAVIRGQMLSIALYLESIQK